jgi:hypothetical protein
VSCLQGTAYKYTTACQDPKLIAAPRQKFPPSSPSLLHLSTLHAPYRNNARTKRTLSSAGIRQPPPACDPCTPLRNHSFLLDMHTTAQATTSATHAPYRPTTPQISNHHTNSHIRILATRRRLNARPTTSPHMERLLRIAPHAPPDRPSVFRRRCRRSHLLRSHNYDSEWVRCDAQRATRRA